MYRLTANKELRDRMKKNHVTLWQIAEKIGIHEKTLVAWMRFTLDDERFKRVNDALNVIIAGDK